MTDDELKGLLQALRQETVANREQNAAAHTETRRQFDEVAARIATETRRQFDEVAARIATENQHFDEVAARFATENQRQFDVIAARSATENQQHFDEVAARITTENQQHFDEVAARFATENQHFFATGFERLRHEIQLVAEGVASTREALSREAADIRDELRRTATETQAMIKFSHAELDRRISTLEQTQTRLGDALTDLQARVERLESSTH